MALSCIVHEVLLPCALQHVQAHVLVWVSAEMFFHQTKVVLYACAAAPPPAATEVSLS